GVLAAGSIRARVDLRPRFERRAGRPRMMPLRQSASSSSRRSSRLRCAIVLASASFVCVAHPAFADQRNRTGTIKDLESREVEVVRDPPTDVTPQQAIEQYRRFLELQSSDERMRAEAMRRLGDLQLEVDESARAVGETFSGLEIKEAIQLYE